MDAYCAELRTRLPDFFPPAEAERDGLPVIFTDGSGNGWAATVLGEEVFVMKTPFVGQNNAAELSAVWLGLCVAENKGIERFVLVSDSRNARGWLLEGWKIHTPAIAEVVAWIRKSGGLTRISQWDWVRGHGGTVGNTRCDQACRQAAGGDLTGLIEVLFPEAQSKRGVEPRG